MTTALDSRNTPHLQSGRPARLAAAACLLTCFGILFSLPIRAEEFRTFTTNKGNSQQAAIVSVEANTVTLKLEDGRVIQGAAVSAFSPEDQEYIKNWAKSNPSNPSSQSDQPTPAPADYRFQMKLPPTKVRKEVVRTEEGAVKVTYEDWAYNVELENKGRADLANVTVEYRVYKKRGDVDAGMASAKEKELQESGGLAYREGKFAAGDMGQFQKVQFETLTIPIASSDLKGGWVYNGGKTAGKIKDDLAGIWIRVIHGGKPVFEDKSTVKSPVTW